MYYLLPIIVVGIIIAIIIILLLEKFTPKPEFRIFKDIKFQWVCGKSLPRDEVPHWKCERGQCTICILPPAKYGARWRVLKERSEQTIGYQEIEEEEKAFDLAVQWVRES